MSSAVQTQRPAAPSQANGMNATANGGGYRKIANPPATSTVVSYSGWPSSSRWAACTYAS